MKTLATHRTKIGDERQLESQVGDDSVDQLIESDARPTPTNSQQRPNQVLALDKYKESRDFYVTLCRIAFGVWFASVLVVVGIEITAKGVLHRPFLV